MISLRAALCGAVVLLSGACFAHGQQDAPKRPTETLIHRPTQGFVANKAGTYTLPVIQEAADGWVLEDNWIPRRLSSYTKGSVTLLSFIYTYCTDPAGCPLAYETFEDLKKRVLSKPSLKGNVRFVSLSFDPGNDTPEAMRIYGGGRQKDARLPWHFLTTYSLHFLRPILDGYGQDVEVELDNAGKPTRVLTHMLKVFLLDHDGMVREIYSSAFLHPEVMLNDIETLVLEANQKDRSKL